MARRNWSVQDAKNRFSEVVKAAQREPQTVSKHGRPAVVIIAADEYERLHKLQESKAPSFIDMLLAIPKTDATFERVRVKPRDLDL